MIVPGMFVCSSFLISVCMFIVSIALLISSATVIVRAGGAICLKPFATVLFSVCSAVTVECCGLYRVAWVCLVCLLLCKEEGSSPVSAITERRDMGLYEVPCCCLPTPMTLASGGSPMFPLVVHQPASPSIWPAVQSLRRGLSTNPGATMWCVCGCS